MEILETKERFIELRAKGWSFDKIAKEIGKAKQTLIDWSKDLELEIANRKALELEAIQEKYLLYKEARIKSYGIILSKITKELEDRSFSNVPTGRLLELYLLYFERLNQDIKEPTYKTSKEIEEDKIDKLILDSLTTTETNNTILKVG